jgi:hypothetical protein
MYVCVCVRMYCLLKMARNVHVGMYVCMYVCMFLCVWMCVYAYVGVCWLTQNRVVCMYVRIYLCMYVRTYVYMLTHSKSPQKWKRTTVPTPSTEMVGRSSPRLQVWSDSNLQNMCASVHVCVWVYMHKAPEKNRFKKKRPHFYYMNEPLRKYRNSIYFTNKSDTHI